MAIQFNGKDGEMRLVLRVKDDGSIVVDKFADHVDKSAKKSNKAFGDFASGAGISFRSIATYSGIAAAAVVAGGAAIVAKQVEIADATKKAADKLGTTTEAVSQLAYTAKKTADVEFNQLVQSLQVMTRNISDAAQNTGDARFAIMDLGLDAQELARMRPEQAIAAIADQLERIPNNNDRVRIAMEVFRNADMVNALRGGSAALKDMAEQARRAGKEIGSGFAANAQKVKDQFERLQEIGSKIAYDLASALVPALLDSAEQFLAAYENGGLFHGMLTAIGSISVTTIERIQVLTREVAALTRELNRMEEREIGSILDDDDAFTGDDEDRLRETIAAKEREIAALKQSMETGSSGGGAKGGAGGAGGGGAPGSGSRELQAAMDEAAKSGTAIAEEQAKQRQAALDNLRARTEDLRASLMTDAELERASYEQRIAALYEANQTILEIDDEGNMARLLSDEEFKRMREQLELEHQAKLGDLTAQGALQRQQIEKMTMLQQAQFYFGQLQQITAGAATHSKTMFRLNQVAGIGNAIISGKVGATKALEWGWPMGPIFAGIIWAAAAANVAQIASAKFGGGTSAPSIAGGGATPVTPAFGPPTVAPFESGQPAASQSVVQVIVNGNFIGNDEAAEWLGNVIKDKITNNDLVLITPQSRQARELATAPA